MNLRNFEDFLKDGVVKRQRIDLSRSESLEEEAEKRKAFLKEMSDRIAISDSNANYFVETAYDVIMELLRAILYTDGFKAAGLSAHEAEISYMRNLGISESKMRTANELRYFRNGIVYYGKSVNEEYAKKVLDFLEKIYTELKSHLRKKKVVK